MDTRRDCNSVPLDGEGEWRGQGGQMFALTQMPQVIIHAYTPTCLHSCLCTCVLQGCTHVCTPTCSHICACFCGHTHMPVHRPIRISAPMSVYLCMYPHIYPYTYPNPCLFTCWHAYARTMFVMSCIRTNVCTYTTSLNATSTALVQQASWNNICGRLIGHTFFIRAGARECKEVCMMHSV